MNTHDLDRRLSDWIQDGPTGAPEHSIAAALGHARANPRRRDPLAVLRRDPMGRRVGPLRAASAAGPHGPRAAARRRAGRRIDRWPVRPAARCRATRESHLVAVRAGQSNAADSAKSAGHPRSFPRGQSNGVRDRRSAVRAAASPRQSRLRLHWRWSRLRLGHPPHRPRVRRLPRDQQPSLGRHHRQGERRCLGRSRNPER